MGMRFKQDQNISRLKERIEIEMNHSKLQIKPKMTKVGDGCMGHALYLMHSLRDWYKLAWAMHKH